jgi:hypothetical protein
MGRAPFNGELLYTIAPFGAPSGVGGGVGMGVSLGKNRAGVLLILFELAESLVGCFPILLEVCLHEGPVEEGDTVRRVKRPTSSMQVATMMITPCMIPFASKQWQNGNNSDKINDTVATTLKLYHGMIEQCSVFFLFRREVDSFLLSSRVFIRTQICSTNARRMCVTTT